MFSTCTKYLKTNVFQSQRPHLLKYFETTKREQAILTFEYIRCAHTSISILALIFFFAQIRVFHSSVNRLLEFYTNETQTTYSLILHLFIIIEKTSIITSVQLLFIRFASKSNN